MIVVIEKTNKMVARVAAYCALLMMMAQVFSVIARYVFSYGLISVQESVIYGHSIMFLLGAAFVLQMNEHVRVDIFYEMFSPRTRHVIDLIGLLFFVIPVAGLILWVATPYVMRSWASLEGSRQAGGIPAIFLLKTAMVVFGVSVLAQALATFAKIIGHSTDDAWKVSGRSHG
ncbi:TRAP transporter small permease subunit [Yoonia sp.]|uniref:TRAP transporter small permease subunit n=1 Tax=Yoonia sp. TaxID=2212373 RepID=UPI003F6CCAF5